jgi:hypothetical protein
MSLLLLMGGSAPNVASLFANNEAGLALDVEAAYLRGWVFQDSAGATVAAAAGDPVGLILDTSKGGLDQLGSDLVSNGTFASDTVWSKGANWTIGSGVATKTGGAANNLTQTISSTANQWYRITMDVTRTAGTLTVSLGTSGTTYAMSASGSYTFYILAGSSTQTLTLAGDSSFAGTVDNVTARLVPGNHAYQTTSGSRPLLARTPDGGRRNLLTYSEQFDNAAWTKSNSATVTQNTSTAPDGTTTADTIEAGTTGVNRQVSQTFALTSGNQRTFSCYLKAATTSVAFLQVSDNVANATGRYFDLSNGTPGGQTGLTAGTTVTLDSSSITSIGSGWYRCQVTVSVTASTNFLFIVGIADANNSTTSTANKTIIAWGAQLETGSTATAYQKVGLTSDVTESGKRDCWGLLFDGSDDSLQTASVDFSATDKMTVMAGVRKLSDAAIGMIAELTASANSNNGAFYLRGPGVIGANYYFASGGTALNQTGTPENYAAPITNVISCSADISAPLCRGRFNGAEVINSTSSQGSGNFANAAVYIGSRAGSSLRFNGLLYTLIIRGATTPTGTIADFERNLLARRCGVTF